MDVFVRVGLMVAAESGIRYLLFAGIGWLLAYVIFRRRWRHRKIDPRYPSSSEIWREVRWSMLTVLVYGVVGALTFWVAKRGWTQMYFKVHERSWAWFGASVGLTILLHDAYFYWTHRAMHDRRLFKLFHRVHHQSTNPSPWAAYAFSPLEAVVQAGIFPLTALLIPIHPIAFGLFMIWQLAFNVFGHTGYEFYPRWFLKSWAGAILNTTTNHALHHEYIRGGYGLYFSFWDRLMGTHHERYEERFAEVTSRPHEEAAPSPAYSLGISCQKSE